ncbi:MAG TPA: protein-tyrosine-phosphatase [Pirellulaceae bacterium]
MSPLILSLAVLTTTLAADNSVRLNPPLQKYIATRSAEFDLIPADRKDQLNQLAHYVHSRLQSKQPARLTFICTHNSRRSHLAQIWAQTAAAHFGLPNVETFSGGTEATAFNRRAIDALRRAGFDISSPEPGPKDNPHFQVRFAVNASPLECFSKLYNEPPNPKTNFCAILTCSQADKSCPLVEGASFRIAIPYDDPKTFDDTPDESRKYDDRCQQIAREMLYLFSQVQNRPG